MANPRRTTTTFAHCGDIPAATLTRNTWLMSLLYVMNDFPSASETFVVNEAAAVRRHGVPVVGYALRRGSASRPAASVELIVAPPSRRELVAAGLSRAPAIVRLIVRAGREGLAL